MNISTINVSRVSENLKSLRLLESLRQNTLKLFNEENRLATGYQLLTPSEDPIGASRAIEMNQLLEQQDQILNNLQFADGFMSATDNAIVDVNSLLIQAHDLASEHAGNTTDQDQRDAAAIQLESIVDQLVIIGNRTHQGRYLFAGRDLDRAPFSLESGYVEFVGDTGDLSTRVDREQIEAYNLPGDRLYGALSAEVESWVDWNPNVTLETRLTDCLGTTGDGIELESIEIVDTGIATFTVDLSEADGIGDVIDLINDAAATAGSGITAAVNAAGNGLRLNGAAVTMEVHEVGGAKTARDLGLLTAGPVVNVVGGDIQPKLTKLTRLGDLAGVNMADLAAGFVITNGNASELIDTSVLAGTNTVQDLVNLINDAEIGVLAEINDAATGLNIVSRRSGSLMSIGENGGATAEALGIRSMHGGTRLSDLNRGVGVQSVAGEADFSIVARDGTSFDVDLNDPSGGMDVNGDGFETLDDALLAINNAAAGAGVAVTASLSSTGNGIELSDTTGVNGTLRVLHSNLSSYAVVDLGLKGLEASGAGPAVTAVGDDVNQITPESVFTALLDLQDALRRGDAQAITRAGGAIEEAMTNVNEVLGEVGTRAKAMTDRVTRTEEAVMATQKVLSEVRDLDYTEAITRFQQAQTALQANLMASSKLMNLSLLDFVR